MRQRLPADREDQERDEGLARKDQVRNGLTGRRNMLLRRIGYGRRMIFPSAIFG